jgi:hypothetical protein
VPAPAGKDLQPVRAQRRRAPGHGGAPGGSGALTGVVKLSLVQCGSNNVLLRIQFHLTPFLTSGLPRQHQDSRVVIVARKR